MRVYFSLDLYRTKLYNTLKQWTWPFVTTLCLLVSLISLNDKKLVSKNKSQRFHVHDRAKWDLGGAASYVTSGTGHGLRHSRDFWLSFDSCQNVFGLFVIHILSKLAKIFKWKNCSFTIRSLAAILTAAMYLFFYFEVRVRQTRSPRCNLDQGGDRQFAGPSGLSRYKWWLKS